MLHGDFLFGCPVRLILLSLSNALYRVVDDGNSRELRRRHFALLPKYHLVGGGLADAYWVGDIMRGRRFGAHGNVKYTGQASHVSDTHAAEPPRVALRSPLYWQDLIRKFAGVALTIRRPLVSRVEVLFSTVAGKKV